MQPWQQPPQRPPSNSTTWIVLLVVGLLLLMVGVPLVIGVAIGFMRVSAAHRAASAATAVSTSSPLLTESYTTTNKLLTIHYPADFAAKSLDDSTLLISRNFGNGEDEVVTFGALVSPISNDPHELGRVLLDSLAKNVAAKGGTYVKNSERRATCLLKYPGIEVESTFTLPPLAPYTSKTCVWVNATHGYELRYDVPKSRMGVEVPLLERIENATELSL